MCFTTANLDPTSARVHPHLNPTAGILADITELSLHQLEIERLETVGTLCRKLQILYLQNNIIGKMEGLHHLKDLRCVPPSARCARRGQANGYPR